MPSLPQVVLIQYQDGTPLMSPSPPDPRLALAERFLHSRGLSASTIQSYRGEFRRFLAWTPKPWHEIEPIDLEDFQRFLEQKGRARSTVSRSLSSLQSFFQWMVRQELLHKDPTVRLTRPRPDPPQARDLKEEEIQALLEAAEFRDSWCRDRALLYVLWHGLRASEVLSLDLKDYDGVRLRVHTAKVGGIRTVPLITEARFALDTWIQERGADVTSEEPVFISFSRAGYGKRLSYQGLYRIVETIADLAGVKGVHPHRMRHSYATRLVRGGMDTMMARKLTGHRSEASFQVYSDRALEIEAENQFWQRVEGNPGS